MTRVTRFLAAVSVLSCLALATPDVAGATRDQARTKVVPGWPVETVPGSLLVTRADGTTTDVRVPPGEEAVAAAELSDEAGVVAVEPNHLRRVLRAPNDPTYPEQWGHALTRVEGAWDVTTGLPAAKVAVIDTGIDGRHPDLRPNLVRQVDVSSGQVVDRGLGIDNDLCAVGHGTAVAGVIGAVGNNAQGVAGVAWQVSILDVAASDPVKCGVFSDGAIVAGVDFAVAQKVDVINLSLGAPSDACPTAFQAAFDRARAAGITVVAAAGNEEAQFPGLTSAPASCNGVIAVGAVGISGTHARYSNANAFVDVAAPGGDAATGTSSIVSTARGGGFSTQQGTSFASPYVAGAIALLRSARPTLTPAAVEAILEGTTVGAPARHTDELGWGIVDVGAAVRAARDGTIPVAKGATLFPVGLVVRVSAQTSATDAAKQAVAISRTVFPSGKAEHVVLARRDDFADALSGSALGFGVGPVLFTGRTGPLDVTTRSEVARVLPPSGRVYLLGGPAALPSSLETELQGMGFTPVRIAGATRDATAALVAAEVVQRTRELGFRPPLKAILATSRQWPDAVTAGALGAWFGYPILLTDPNTLSDATRDALASLRPQTLLVVGGTSAVSSPVAVAARDAGGSAVAVRLAGNDRNTTAVEVAKQFASDLQATQQVDPLLTIGVNLRRDDGFTHVLSASAAAGALAGVFLPIDGTGGTTVPGPTVTYACTLSPVRAMVVGEEDVVADTAKQRLNDLLEHTAPDCKR
jgi:subtilisin family serine protease